jgi:hypothetical protein
MGHSLHIPRGSFEKRLKKGLARWGVIVQIVDVDRAKPAGRWPVLRTKRYPSTLIDEEWDCAVEVSRRGLMRDAGYLIASPPTPRLARSCGSRAGILTSLLAHSQTRCSSNAETRSTDCVVGSQFDLCQLHPPSLLILTFPETDEKAPLVAGFSSLWAAEVRSL